MAGESNMWQWAIPIIMGGISALANAGGGDDNQKRQSYKGEGPLDPRLLMAQGLGSLAEIGNAVQKRVAKPTTLRSAYVQPLNMNIPGLPNMPQFAQDPAYRDRSLLTIPGLDILGGDLFPGGREPYDRYYQTNAPHGSTPQTGGSPVPPGVSPVPHMGPPSSPLQQPGDSKDEALKALELLGVLPRQRGNS